MNFLKNLLVGVICIVIFAFGYYFLTQSNDDITLAGEGVTADQIFQRTSVFIERRTKLESLNLKTELFTDPRFTSLRSYATPVPEQGVGRDNIFAAPLAVSNSRTISKP